MDAYYSHFENGGLADELELYIESNVEQINIDTSVVYKRELEKQFALGGLAEQLESYTENYVKKRR